MGLDSRDGAKVGSWPSVPTRKPRSRSSPRCSQRLWDEGALRCRRRRPRHEAGRSGTTARGSAIPTCCSVCRHRPDWRSARSSRSAAWRSMSTEPAGGADTERRRLPRRHRTAQGQLAALRAQLHANTIRQRRRSSRRTRNCSDPDLLEIAESAIAKGRAPRSRGRRRRHHAERLAALRNELLAQRANDLRDVGARAPVLTGVDAASLRIRRTPSSSRRISRRRIPRRSTARAWRALHDPRRRHVARRDPRALARHPALAGIEPRARGPERHAVMLDGSTGRCG